MSSTWMWIAVVSPTRVDPLQVCSEQWRTCRGNSSSCRRLLCSRTLAGRSLIRRASPPPSSPGSTATGTARRSSPRPSAGTSTPSALSSSVRRLHPVELLHKGHKQLRETPTSLHSVPRYQPMTPHGKTFCFSNFVGSKICLCRRL